MARESSEEDDDTLVLIEEYACQVLDFSSQYGSDESFSYAAINCLGVPNKFPAYGDFHETFVIREYGDFWEKCPSGMVFRKSYCSNEKCGSYQNFIDLKYEHSIFVSAIYIYETFNPGAVVSIWGGDCCGRWVLLYDETSNEQRFVGHKPRAFSPQIRSDLRFPIQMIRLVFCHNEIPYHTEIDGVALLGTNNCDAETTKGLVAFRSRKPVPDILDKVSDRGITSCRLENIQQLLDLDLVEIGEKALHEPQDVQNNGYFDLLPKEVIFHIFSLLDLVSLCRCSQTSKILMQIAYDPQLYCKLSLKSLFFLVSDKFLQCITSRCSNLTALDLSWCGNYSKISPPTLAEFLKSCGRGILYLRFNNCHSANRIVIKQISSSCKNLLELSLSNCHLLEEMDFEPISALRELKYLNVARTRIGRRQINDLIRNVKSLECLNVSLCHHVNGDELCENLAKFQPKLRTLEMWRVTSLTSAGILHISRSLFNLEELDVGWCTVVNAASGCIVELVSQCTKLVKLILTAHRQVSDRDIVAIEDSLPNLRQLDIMGTRHVSPRTIRSLLQQNPSMELLDIANCEQLESQEFIRALKNDFSSCNIMHTFH